VSAPVARFVAVGSRVVPPGLLSAAELARRDRLRHLADRAAYAAAHLLAREVAAELLGVTADRVDLRQRCPGCGAIGHGRPEVLGVPEVFVSLAHTRRHVAAIAAPAPCGIDVEEAVPGRLVAGALAERERRWVARQREPGRAFARLWTRKEALVKAGVGSLADAAALDVLDDDGRRWGGWESEDHVGSWVVC
jgi:4'-phosphopantetheinyl transferase